MNSLKLNGPRVYHAVFHVEDMINNLFYFYTLNAFHVHLTLNATLSYSQSLLTRHVTVGTNWEFRV